MFLYPRNSKASDELVGGHAKYWFCVAADLFIKEGLKMNEP